MIEIWGHNEKLEKMDLFQLTNNHHACSLNENIQLEMINKKVKKQ